MNSLSIYIIEKLKINKDSNKYHYHPKDKDELRSLIKELLEKRGKDADLNDIDVSDITDMSDLFYGLDTYNIDISKWNVSNVEKLSHMFYRCNNFNSDLSKRNVSNVKGMDYIFDGCNSLKNKPSWYHEQFKYIYQKFKYIF